MTSSPRIILSSITGLGLIAFVALSATTAGSASTNVVLGLSGLVAWALIQIAALDFAPRSVRTTDARARETSMARAASAIAFHHRDGAHCQAA